MANRMNLLGQLDYYGKLSAQLEWQHQPGDRPFRVVYAAAGKPTASIVVNDGVLIDYKLFWTACRDMLEAHYLVAVINSIALYERVTPLMSKGQFGARDLQKHLWKLPIPEFDACNPLHVSVSQAGEEATLGATTRLEELRRARSELTATIARREIRKYLRESIEGKAVERVVGELLSSDDPLS